MRVRARRARAGFTLVECLVILTLIGVTLGSVALAMHATRRSDRRLRDAVRADLEIGRFARHLRRDAHEARSAEVAQPDASKPPSVLSLALADDRTVEYALQAQGIRRVLKRGETVVQRETYRLPRASDGRWDLSSGDRSPMVSFVLQPPPDGLRGEWEIDVYRIDAAVGLFQPRWRSKP